MIPADAHDNPRQGRQRCRTGRFGEAQPVAADAPAIDRLAAFLGRSLGGDAEPASA